MKTEKRIKESFSNQLLKEIRSGPPVNEATVFCGTKKIERVVQSFKLKISHWNKKELDFASLGNAQTYIKRVFLPTPKNSIVKSQAWKTK